MENTLGLIKDKELENNVTIVLIDLIECITDKDFDNLNELLEKHIEMVTEFSKEYLKNEDNIGELSNYIGSIALNEKTGEYGLILAPDKEEFINTKSFAVITLGSGAIEMQSWENDVTNVDIEFTSDVSEFIIERRMKSQSSTFIQDLDISNIKESYKYDKSKEFEEIVVNLTKELRKLSEFGNDATVFTIDNTIVSTGYNVASDGNMDSARNSMVQALKMFNKSNINGKLTIFTTEDNSLDNKSVLSIIDYGRIVKVD